MLMKEIRDIIAEFERRRSEPLALATLVRARGSSYRRPGARMLIAQDGVVVGVLSGGCLEEEVAARAREVIATGVPSFISFDTRLRYGCNGAIDIFIESSSPPFFDGIAAAMRERRECVVATTFAGSQSLGSRIIVNATEASEGTFVQVLQPPLQLVLIGHGPDSAPLRS